MYKLPLAKHVASFDVDVRKTFSPLCPQELPVPHANDIVVELNRQAQRASVRIASKDCHSAKALWVADEHYPPFTPIAGLNMDMRWPVHAVLGTLGFECLEGLPSIQEYDYVVWKGMELDMHPYGACYHDLAETLSTGVIEFLQTKDITTVLIGGLATEYCVKTTALQLQHRGFQCVLNLAACRGINAAAITTAINILQATGVVVVESSHELNWEILS